MTKPLNVGMIGYGFMAKAHSNAWRRVANFFPEVEHRPVVLPPRVRYVGRRVWSARDVG